MERPFYFYIIFITHINNPGKAIDKSTQIVFCSMKQSSIITLFACFLFTGIINAQTAGSSAPGQPVTGEKKGWPSSERYGFISECIRTASASMSEDSARYYCYCMQEKIEQKFPAVDELAKLTEKDMESEEWKKEINSCMFGYWSTAQRGEFMNDCTEAAKSIGEEKAKNYCECIMFQIEKRYPSFEQANKLTEKDFATPMWKKIIQASLDF